MLARVWRGPERERQAFLSLVLDEQGDVNLQDLLAWQHVSEVKTLDAPGRAFLKNVALSETVTIDGHEKLTADAREDGSRPAESRV